MTREWVLYGRKIAGRPYGGTWQPRVGGSLRRVLTIWWQEERHREFDAWRLRRRWVSYQGVIQP